MYHTDFNSTETTQEIIVSYWMIIYIKLKKSWFTSSIVNFCFDFVVFYWSTKKPTAVCVASIHLSMVGIPVRDSVYSDKLLLLISVYSNWCNLEKFIDATGVVCTKSSLIWIAQGKHCLNKGKYFIINRRGILWQKIVMELNLNIYLCWTFV